MSKRRPLTPEYQAVFARLLYYAPQNPKAIELLDPQLARLMPSHPENEKLAHIIDYRWWAALDAHGSFVAINNKVSQSVPHVHVHVVPRRRKDGLRGFFWPREPYAGDAEREEFAARIRRALR